jgi:hypothetical protein
MPTSTASDRCLPATPTLQAPNDRPEEHARTGRWASSVVAVNIRPSTPIREHIDPQSTVLDRRKLATGRHDWSIVNAAVC